MKGLALFLTISLLQFIYHPSTAQEFGLQLGASFHAEILSADNNLNSDVGYTRVYLAPKYEALIGLSRAVFFGGYYVSGSTEAITLLGVGGSSPHTLTSDLTTYGVSLQFGVPRHYPCIFYCHLDASYMKMEDTFVGFNPNNGQTEVGAKYELVKSGFAFKGGFGIMFKLGRFINFKLIELGFGIMNSDLKYEKATSPLISAESGISFNLARKR